MSPCTTKTSDGGNLLRIIRTRKSSASMMRSSFVLIIRASAVLGISGLLIQVQPPPPRFIYSRILRAFYLGNGDARYVYGHPH